MLLPNILNIIQPIFFYVAEKCDYSRKKEKHVIQLRVFDDRVANL